MAEKAKILFVTEGARTEPAFFSRLAVAFELNATIVSVRANIYALYAKMKNEDFQLDLPGALLEMNLSREDRAKLDDRFAYTYLVFDLDVQHGSTSSPDADIEAIVRGNLEKLPELAAHFTDETDPTIGRLYINYPMMESYRDADRFFDETYSERALPLTDVHRYKELVGERGLSHVRIDRYSETDFSSLAKMNVFKLNMFYDGWGAMGYGDFRKRSECSAVLEAERTFIQDWRRIPVLNTSTFFILDYFGNARGFYDHVMGQRAPAHTRPI